MMCRMALVVLMDGHIAGAVKQDRHGELTLTYDDEWAQSATATPLSVSMPLAQRTHDDAIRPYLLGLLPDNEKVLERWARTYHASARNPFALLGHVGEDCAGAVQFITPDRVESQLAREGGVTWMSEAEVADRIRLLRRDPAAWHIATTGNFSLGGAQSKTALHYDQATGRWGTPWGVVPTTHILKPAISGLDDHDLNEHLCLAAAQRPGREPRRPHGPGRSRRRQETANSAPPGALTRHGQPERPPINVSPLRRSAPSTTHSRRDPQPAEPDL
jgi:serine/threonine-protein kinase HipA